MSVLSLVELIEQRDEALLRWQAVKRLNGPCVALYDERQMPPILNSVRTIGRVRFTPKQRAGSYCTQFDRLHNWCENCEPCFKFWNRYLVLAHQVQKEMGDGL